MIIKKTAAVLTAAAMAVTSLAAFASAEMNYPYTAVLGFADGSWTAQDWNTSVSISENGTYTITTNSEIWLENSDKDEEILANGANVFVIDIKGLGTDLDPEGEGIAKDMCTFSDVKVAVNGEEIAVDQSKLAWGDLEGNGDVRLEIYNAYGPTKDDPSIDPDDIAGAEEISVTFTIDIAEEEPNVTEPEEPGDLDHSFKDPANTVHAFFDYSDDCAAKIGVIPEGDAIPEGAKFTVRFVDDLTNDDQIAYNCTFTLDGKEIEPNGKVTVWIPIPESMEDIADTLKVYHYVDGKYTVMNTRVEPGHLVFKTDHFSTYVVTAKNLINEETPDDTTEAPSTPDDTTEAPETPDDTTAAPANPDKEDNPNTGVGSVAVVMGISIAAAGTVMILGKRRK